MRILGIDPGYGITGFGLIEAQRGQTKLLRCGAITTPPNTDFFWRLGEIYNNMTELMALAKPDAVAIEELFFGNNVTTGIKVAQARGVILLAGYRQNIPIVPVTPLQVKQQMTGYGRAGKKQVIEMVKRLMGIHKNIDPDDAADALAIGLTAAYHVEHRQLYGGMK